MELARSAATTPAQTMDDRLDAGLPAEPFTGYRRPLERAAELALEYLEGLPGRHVGADPGVEERIQAELRRPLGDDGESPDEVIAELAATVDPGLTAMSGPRYFGFVIGGTLPAALAADWLVSAWDQNAPMHLPAPAAAGVEVAAGEWLVDLLGFAPGTSVGFATGATTANLTCMTAARHEVLRRAGWDVEASGLQGAPTVTVVAGEEIHPSMVKALRMVGLGARTGIRVGGDGQGRIRADGVKEALARTSGPVIVVLQLGNVNSGAFDPLDEIVPMVRELPNAWLHVDGAFGLWAAASPRLRSLAGDLSGVDSAATDAHKWLNTPYDTGLAFIRNEAAIRAAMSISAAYLPATPGQRDPMEYVPEMSRRARGFPVYAALRSLGRHGLAEMIDRNCAIASFIAERLSAQPGIRVLNDVVLNQVLVRFGDDDAVTREVIARVQNDGTMWAGGTVWHGLGAMRLSVSGGPRDAWTPSDPWRRSCGHWVKPETPRRATEYHRHCRRHVLLVVRRVRKTPAGGESRSRDAQRPTQSAPRRSRLASFCRPRRRGAIGHLARSAPPYRGVVEGRTPRAGLVTEIVSEETMDSFEEPGGELWLIQQRQQELIREAEQYRLARTPSEEALDLVDGRSAVAVAAPNPIMVAVRRAFSASVDPPCDDPCPDCVGC